MAPLHAYRGRHQYSARRERSLFELSELTRPTVHLPGERPRLCRLAETAQARLAAETSGLAAEEQAWLAAFPLARSLAAAAAHPPFSEYTFVPKRLREVEHLVGAAGGDAWKVRYSRLLLLAAIARLPSSELPLRIPTILWDHVEDGIEGFLGVMDSCGTADWSDGDFRKDLAVARLHMLPNEGIATIGVLLHPWYQMSRARLRERWGVMTYLGRETFLRGLYTTGHSWRGFKDGRDLPTWRRWSRNCALLAANPTAVAILRAGWNDDPLLATISPYVNARSRQFLALGGRRFRMNTSAEVVRLATSTSETRRRLYEEGKYLPTTYGIFLKRGDVLRWGETAVPEGEE